MTSGIIPGSPAGATPGRRFGHHGRNEQEHSVSESIRVLDLRDYWRMIRTRIWTVLAMATIVAAIAGAYVALRPPTYYSQAKVIVDPLVNPAITGTAIRHRSSQTW